MIRRVAHGFSGYLVAAQIIDAEDKEFCAYGLNCMLATTIQFIILLILAPILGVLPHAVACVAAFGFLKRIVGGCHATNNRDCLIISTIMVLSLCLLAKQLEPDWRQVPACYIALCIMWILVLLKAPVIHKYNPKTPAQIAVIRRRALLRAALISIAIIICLRLLARQIPMDIVLAGALGGMSAAITLIVPTPQPEGGETA